MSTPSPSESPPVPSPDALARGCTPEELAEIAAKTGKRVRLDPIGRLAWVGLQAMQAESHRRVASVESEEENRRKAELLHFLSHLGCVGLMGPGVAAFRVTEENGEAYLVAVPSDPKE